MKKILLPRSAKGQSLVEFAVSLVILLYLLSGAVEFGILFFQYVQLRDAAQEGALYGSSNLTDSTANSTELTEIENRARASSPSISPIDLTDTSKVTVSIYVDDTLVWQNGSSQGTTTSACESHELRVTVSYTHEIFMPFMPQLIGRDAIPLNALVADTILTPLCPPP